MCMSGSSTRSACFNSSSLCARDSRRSSNHYSSRSASKAFAASSRPFVHRRSSPREARRQQIRRGWRGACRSCKTKSTRLQSALPERSARGAVNNVRALLVARDPSPILPLRQDRCPDVEWVILPTPEGISTPDLRGIELAYLWDYRSKLLRDMWSTLPELRWVHVAAAGVDA